MKGIALILYRLNAIEQRAEVRWLIEALAEDTSDPIPERSPGGAVSRDG